MGQYAITLSIKKRKTDSMKTEEVLYTSHPTTYLGTPSPPSPPPKATHPYLAQVQHQRGSVNRNPPTRFDQYNIHQNGHPAISDAHWPVQSTITLLCHAGDHRCNLPDANPAARLAWLKAWRPRSPSSLGHSHICDSDEMTAAPMGTHEAHESDGTRHNSRLFSGRACNWAWDVCLWPPTARRQTLLLTWLPTVAATRSIENVGEHDCRESV
jgi:hypothetical protein